MFGVLSWVQWQQDQKLKPRGVPGAFFVPNFGAPGGTRTHNPRVRSLIVPVLFCITRYVLRTPRPPHPGAFVSEVLFGVATC